MGEKEVIKAKVDVKTAVYKVHVHCGQCAKDIETQFTEFHGVEEVKVDRGAGKVTVKGVGFDVEKLRTKVEKGCRKKVEFIPPAKDIITEVKTKEQELKIITVKVPLHCPDCAVRVKEILLEHKNQSPACRNARRPRTLGKNTCVVEGVIDEKKLVEYIYQRTRAQARTGTVDKVEKKKVTTDVVAPYFIPCTHPHFVDYSHPWHRCGGGDYCSPYGYGGGGCGYPPYGVSYTQSELKGYQGTAFLHCSHPNEFISEENPYACSVM
ncbi:hypothetical protein PR202_ga19204 [Eleusine coracana subsp. coracana]|uniref:HMA domain-containing protein n=1 Tax=Eleusine coracana subsp. coracana TaxID=191504 RepID=A0AAV5CUT2_ELECO|nr:hypothetical protein PR202_ga19204 [Eleusine coracana subsp. coracana]